MDNPAAPGYPRSASLPSEARQRTGVGFPGQTDAPRWHDRGYPSCLLSTAGWPLGGALPGRLAPPRPALAGLRAVESAGGVSAVGFTDKEPPPAPSDLTMMQLDLSILAARNLFLVAFIAHDKEAQTYATILLNARLEQRATLAARRKRAALGPR